MPIYPFKCVNCQFEFEEYYHVSEPKPTLCPKCGENTVKQCVGVNSHWFPASAIFNGKWAWVEKRVEKETRNPKKDNY